MHLPVALHRHPRARGAHRDEDLQRRPLVARTVRVLNRTRGTVLSERGRVADDLVSRGIGLVVTSSLRPGDGLLITKTSAITMLFIRYVLDAAFLDPRGRIAA